MISVRLFVLNIWLRPPRVERLAYLYGEFALRIAGVYNVSAQLTG
jgi:hypothetical protein